MEKELQSRAVRTLAVVRVDLAVMRSEVKSLNNLARVTGNDGDLKATTAALVHLDKAIACIDDPRLFHPTLF